MKRIETIAALLLALCFALAFAACSREPDEFTSVQSFAYHFFPEEYEEEYSEFEKTFSLQANADYQLKVDCLCESGTIEIHILYENTEQTVYTADSSAPCSDTISIPAGTTDTVTFRITIGPDTKGQVAGELLVCE